MYSSTGPLHPSKITSSIAQTITREYSKSFMQSFAFWKELPSTHHRTILRLCRFHLSYRGKNHQKGFLKYSIHCFFPTDFLASFLSQFLSGKPTQAHSSCFSLQTKIYRTSAAKFPFALRGFFFCREVFSFAVSLFLLAVRFFSFAVRFFFLLPRNWIRIRTRTNKPLKVTEDTTWLNWSDRTSHLSNDQISADVLSVSGSGSPFSVPRSTFPVSCAPFPITVVW